MYDASMDSWFQGLFICIKYVKINIKMTLKAYNELQKLILSLYFCNMDISP